ncbi:hypothetical protein VPH35_025462 [Triticum aestivum]
MSDAPTGAMAGEEVDETASQGQADMSEIMVSLPRCPVHLTRQNPLSQGQRTSSSPAAPGLTPPGSRRSPSRCSTVPCTRRPTPTTRSTTATRMTASLSSSPSPYLRPWRSLLPDCLQPHLPYSLLPNHTIECGRVVYVCREPKDAMVSFWIYDNKIAVALRRVVGLQSPSPTFEEAFKLFCEGQTSSGPHWRIPIGKAMNLAAFMGCPFSCAEEDAGVVQEIVQLCSFERLSEVNKNASISAMMGIKNDVYFRKGAVGNWKNHMTPEMAVRLDKIVEEALQGSGLTFGISM